MSISAELAERYATEVDVDWCDALLISHSTFGTLAYTNALEPFTGTVLGESYNFLMVPFKISIPPKDNSGRQDLSLVISNIFNQGKVFIDSAITQPDEAILIRYTVFIEGNSTPEYDPPLELTMTDIAITDEVLTAVATRSDILNLKFPREVYRPDFFPGLNRR